MKTPCVAEISTIKSMDVIIPVKRGETRAELLTHLDLELPARNRILGEAPAGAAAQAAV